MALVLTRKPSEVVHIDGPCLVEVWRVRGNTVSLRIFADQEVTILRGELIDEEAEATASPHAVTNELANDVSG